MLYNVFSPLVIMAVYVTRLKESELNMLCYLSFVPVLPPSSAGMHSWIRNGKICMFLVRYPTYEKKQSVFSAGMQDAAQLQVNTQLLVFSTK